MTKLTAADRSQWRNIWCILRSLDNDELEASGAVYVPGFDWFKFQADPHAYLIHAEHVQAAAIWRAVEKRLK